MDREWTQLKFGHDSRAISEQHWECRPEHDLYLRGIDTWTGIAVGIYLPHGAIVHEKLPRDSGIEAGKRHAWAMLDALGHDLIAWAQPHCADSANTSRAP